VDYNFDPAVLQNTFVIAQELFLTETAMLAEVVLPASSAYEKSGTVTNTCGDLQLLKKAGDISMVKSDFEIIVRIGERMGADLRRLVPFGRSGVPADMGQSRGAQSGEADRHSVWLASHNLEPKLSPLDPMAILDEIQRLVPGYDFSRLSLLAGDDEHVTAAEGSHAGTADGLVQIVPANDTLFTSGTLGRYSHTLNSVVENRRALSANQEVMAD
jgi:NADH-quinone oxidoreductase subunit G